MDGGTRGTMDRDIRLKALNDALGEDDEMMARMRSGQMNPLDIVGAVGHGYDSVIGAPTRQALASAYRAINPSSAEDANLENVLSQAAGQVGADPGAAPDFGVVGNALADPFMIGGLAGKGAKLAGQLPRLDMMLARAPGMHAAVDGEAFRAALESANAGRPMIKDMVSEYTPAQLDEFKNFLSGDKMSGYSVKPDGELINVFSGKGGRGDSIMLDARREALSKLDAYDVGGKLPDLYKKHGFNEIRREANWTPGGPDVVYMKKGFVENPQDLDNRALKNALRLRILSETSGGDE